MVNVANSQRWRVIVAALCLCTAWASETFATKTVASPVVAVFPFKVLNKEPEHGHLGEGASEAVINRIVNDKSVRLVEESQVDKAINSLARNQTGLFEEESYLDVGKMVDARFVVVGSVQVVAPQVVVSARLLEVETRQLLASARSIRPLVGVFEAYDEVAGQMLSKMTFHLSQRVAGGESDDDIAVRLLIEEGKMSDPQFPATQDARGQSVAKDMQRALASYNKAVLRNPKSALALLALGDAELRMSRTLEPTDAMRSQHFLNNARTHLKSATDGDSQSKWAWTYLGRAEGMLGNHSAAREAFERALALDESLAAAHYGLAYASLNLGDVDAARAHAERARAGGDPRAQALLERLTAVVASQKPSSAAVPASSP